MSSGRRSPDGKSGIALPARRDRHRACLFLSLIVLIGNLIASGIDAHRAASPNLTPELRGAFRAPRDAGRNLPCAVDRSGRAPIRVRQKYLLGYRVDINRAGLRELADLPGISDATAEAMAAERARLGGFRHSGDLLRVPGIKRKRLKKILPFLTGFHNN
ncbi:MAG: hypothetical protein Kow00128_19980 [Deltaproteobacteria bacterium]